MGEEELTDEPLWFGSEANTETERGPVERGSPGTRVQPTSGQLLPPKLMTTGPLSLLRYLHQPESSLKPTSFCGIVMECIHHVHASLDLSRMMREFKVKHVTRDDGMKFENVPALHQCFATSSHHPESKILIVIFALSEITGQ